MTKIRPNRFKFDAFDAGLSDVPIVSEDDSAEIESEQTERNRSKKKTLQEHLDGLAKGLEE